MCSIVEGQGLRTLEADMRCTGIIYRTKGETFESFCERIAAEYHLTLDTARIALERYDN